MHAGHVDILRAYIWIYRGRDQRRYRWTCYLSLYAEAIGRRHISSSDLLAYA